MTESRRVHRLREQAKLLKNLKRNTKIPSADLVDSHHFVANWIAAYHLGHAIVSVREVEKYIILLGPLWDFLKEHSLEISHHQQRRELIINYIHGRHHL